LLTRLGPVVLFSAAIPGQGGLGHLNEQWPRYWVDLFRAKSYVAIDCLRHRIWDDDGVDWWYAQNLLFYPCHTLPPYRRDAPHDCPRAEWLGERGVSLPTWVGMTRQHVRRVAAALLQALEAERPASARA
jgi:hypothetical protein